MLEGGAALTGKGGFHCVCMWGWDGEGSAASLGLDIALWFSQPSGLHPLSVLLILLPSSISRQLLPSPTILQAQFLFCVLHSLLPPPPRVLTGMTGSRLWLGAGQARGEGAHSNTSCWAPPHPALHLQVCLAPGDSAPG